MGVVRKREEREKHGQSPGDLRAEILTSPPPPQRSMVLNLETHAKADVNKILGLCLFFLSCFLFILVFVFVSFLFGFGFGFTS